MLGDFDDVLFVVNDFRAHDFVFFRNVHRFEITLAHFGELRKIHSLCSPLLCEQHHLSHGHAFEEEKSHHGFARLNVLVYRSELERFLSELLFGERGDVDFDDIAEIGHRKQRAFVVDGKSLHGKCVFLQRSEIFLCCGERFLRHKAHLSVLVGNEHSVPVRNRFRFARRGVLVRLLVAFDDDAHTFGVESFFDLQQLVFDD